MNNFEGLFDIRDEKEFQKLVEEFKLILLQLEEGDLKSEIIKFYNHFLQYISVENKYYFKKGMEFSLNFN